MVYGGRCHLDLCLPMDVDARYVATALGGCLAMDDAPVYMSGTSNLLDGLSPQVSHLVLVGR